MLCRRWALTCLLPVFAVASNAFAQFWYGVNGEVPLKIDSSKVLVGIDSTAGIAPADLINEVARIDGFAENAFAVLGAVIYDLSRSHREAVAGPLLEEMAGAQGSCPTRLPGTIAKVAENQQSDRAVHRGNPATDHSHEIVQQRQEC